MTHTHTEIHFVLDVQSQAVTAHCKMCGRLFYRRASAFLEVDPVDAAEFFAALSRHACFYPRVVKVDGHQPC